MVMGKSKDTARCIKHFENRNVINWMLLIIAFLSYPIRAQEMNKVIKDSTFIIYDNPKDVYQGMFSKEKPYHGYFREGEGEIFTVDYYENGVKKYNYSLDILQHLYDEEPFSGYRLKLDIKSIYRDNSIFNGLQHHYIKDAVLVKCYQEGKLIGFYIDVFAIHYFNRISFEKKMDGIEIRSVRNRDYKIKLYTKNNFVTAELIKNDQVTLRIQNINPQQPLFPVNSSVSMYKEDGMVKGIAYQNLDITNNVYEEVQELMDILNRLEVHNAQDHVAVFDKLLVDILMEKEFFAKNKTTNSSKIVSEFYTDENGKIKDGIQFLNSKGENYYRVYKNGETMIEEKVTLERFQEVFFRYIEKQYEKKY